MVILCQEETELVLKEEDAELEDEEATVNRKLY
jgi:hypothetical protein